MMEVSFFGALLATLASGLSLGLLLLGLGAATYLGLTGMQAARHVALGAVVDEARAAPRVDRGARIIGAATALLALAIAVLGLRVGAGAVALLPTALVALGSAAALGAAAACAWSFAGRGLVALGAAQTRRAAALTQAGDAQRLALAAARKAHLDGEDLRAEVARADATIGRLRIAVAGLAGTHAALELKLRSLAGPAVVVAGEDPEPATADPALVAEITRARDEAALKIDLGKRVLDAAEAAAFRIACNAPLRILLRRRPRHATDVLVRGPLDVGALEHAAAAIGAFLGDVRWAREALLEVEARRPAHLAPREGDDDDDDPLAAARREIGAMEAAYGALRERLGVARLRLQAQAGAAAVEEAAGAAAGAAALAALDPAEVSALISEVGRAETAVAHAAPEPSGPRALADALVESSAALDRSDAASLADLIAALREIR